MQEERWAQCLAHAKGWVVFSCIIINSGCSFYILCQFANSKSLTSTECDWPPLSAPEKADTSWAMWAPCTECCQSCSGTTQQSGTTPFSPQPRPLHSGQSERAVSCPAKLPRFFGFPTSLLGSALSCSRLCHPSRSCFQASTASWESFLSSFGRALSLHSQGPSLRVRVLSSSLPLSFRLYYCVTSSLHFAIMSWHHYVTMAFLS